MTRLRTLLCVVLALVAGAVSANPPHGPLRIVVGYTPGGASDRAARLVAQALETRYGISVIVDNKPGAGGRLAAQQVLLGKPGEDVLMLGNPAVMTVAPIVFKDNHYDADADFVPVSEVLTYDFAIAVGNDVPARTMPELLAWLKSHPDRALFGVPATGSLPHFFALMLGERIGTKAEVVGYKGSAPLATDVIGGRIAVAIDTLDALLPFEHGGKMRIVAVSGGKRSPFAPDVPTLAESKLDLVADGWNAFFAPKSMPASKVADYAQAIQAVMADPDVRKQFAAASMQAVSTSQADTAAMLKAYDAQWRPVVAKSGFEP